MWHDHCINFLTVASSEMKLQTKNVIKTSMITDRKSTEINLKQLKGNLTITTPKPTLPLNFVDFLLPRN